MIVLTTTTLYWGLSPCLEGLQAQQLVFYQLMQRVFEAARQDLLGEVHWNQRQLRVVDGLVLGHPPLPNDG